MNSGFWNRIIIALIITGCAAAFFVFDLNHYFTLSYLKESREKFNIFYTDNRTLTIIIYMLIYIVMTALSLPGAALLNLAGGALFGFVITLISVSFASTIGATLACFFSRYLLRNWVEKKFRDRLSVINSGIEKEGAFYLFMLRLIPVFPFFLINLLMGLTRIRLVTFYWVSQIGMLAGTAVYVNAGRELGKIESMSGIFSPGLIISFAILGIFPVAVKKILYWYRIKTGKETVG
ncbi:MAG TPA: TVP38/TMEM64 family protein [Spirochaetota bacterium]|nr:TVP38/TMEM64 family protein [Spirochaetota bacterium]